MWANKIRLKDETWDADWIDKLRQWDNEMHELRLHNVEAWVAKKKDQHATNQQRLDQTHQIQKKMAVNQTHQT